MFVFASMQPFTDTRVEIPIINIENLKTWKDNVLLHLECFDIDYTTIQDEPLLSEETTQAEFDLLEKREQSNQFSIMFTRRKFNANVHGSMDQYKNVKELLDALERQFMTFKKSLDSTLTMKFTSTKFTFVKGIREHIKKCVIQQTA